MIPYISKLQIKGFKAFRDTTFDFGRLEVIAGANGSGKSSLFEILKFLRDSAEDGIPPEIIKGSFGQEIFNNPQNEIFEIILDVSNYHLVLKNYPLPERVINLRYSTQISGPRGAPQILKENSFNIDKHELIADRESYTTGLISRLYPPLGKNRFIITAPKEEHRGLSYFFKYWRFYSPDHFDSAIIRKSRFVEQEPQLEEKAGNINSILHYFQTEHPALFDKLHKHLRNVIPSFRKITVKARGGPGEVIAFWQEDGIDRELTIADLSDGIIRLICWTALCLHPSPPTLICIDEPELGVHPRALPILAGLFRKASERTQLLIATHSSYFLTLFDLSEIAVMKKKDGEVTYTKPKDSKVLTGMLDDFGPDEIEAMHRSDELEHFA